MEKTVHILVRFTLVGFMNLNHLRTDHGLLLLHKGIKDKVESGECIGNQVKPQENLRQSTHIQRDCFAAVYCDTVATVRMPDLGMSQRTELRHNA